MIEVWKENLDKENEIMDISKVFDTTDHSLLLTKL